MMVTKVVLVTTLVVTILVLGEVLRRGDLGAAETARFLAFFGLLFLVRVVGQILVALRAPAWLPPMDEWNLTPYRLLLPFQLGIVGVMAWLVYDLARDAGPLAEQRRGFGVLLIGFSAVYAGSMVARYTVRMRRRPEARWFGGAIPIAFHLVLAAFLFTWGRYNVSG